PDYYWNWKTPCEQPSSETSYQYWRRDRGGSEGENSLISHIVELVFGAHLLIATRYVEVLEEGVCDVHESPAHLPGSPLQVRLLPESISPIGARVEPSEQSEELG